MPKKADRERDEFDDQEYLEKRGWKFIDGGLWSWQQPKTKARFTQKDALDTARALDKGKK